MRNLRSIRHDIYRTADCITAACWDGAHDEILVAVGPTEENPQIELSRADRSTFTFNKVASWDAYPPNPDLPVDRIVSLHRFGDGSFTTCLVLAGGDVVIVRENGGVGPDDVDDNSPHIEIVGSIDAGVTAAQWSPDGEVLALATRASTMLFMSRRFDCISETTMTSEDLAASKHVSVGWGKKETQFQGRGAKALRDPTIPEKVDSGSPSPHEDGRTTISWRGDGAYVAVNSIETGSRRAIRVYARGGALDGVSEPVDGLEGSLSWRPAGNLMAAVQRCADRVDVVFFERNGLRHGQFTLTGPHACQDKKEKISLEWNLDSTVLAVTYENVIQLWIMSNYHWYLKQEIPTGPRCLAAVWHPEKPLRIVAAASDYLFSIEYVFGVTKGPLTPPYDYGAVAVIDGTRVKITPFRVANMPPPMTMYEVIAGSSVVDVAFSQDNSSMVVLHHAGLDAYSFQAGAKMLATAPTLSARLELNTTDSTRHDKPVAQICLSTQNAGLHLLHRSDSWAVTTYELDPSNGNINVKVSRDVEPGSVLISPNRGPGVFVQDGRGQLYSLDSVESDSIMKFSAPLPWVEVTRPNDKWLAFGLSRAGNLYANDRLLTRGCTTFLVTYDHLILTTSSHLLKFIHLGDDVDALDVPADDPENDERCRSIERGARLVTAMPTNMSVVLQMPRGNIETIYPRVMVVGGIRQLIDDRDYGRAFYYCRAQRVDMNILYDHKPEQFLENVRRFLEQLGDVPHIDLFLSSLREEDVTQTMYRDTRPSKKQELTAAVGPRGAELPRPGPRGLKVNAICDAVLKSLRSRRGNASLQNIITAHVCKAPPALDDGLAVVAELMREDGSLAEQAVEHMCFLVDVGKLYDHALGLYNLDLALLVAQQSQRDPREYLPFVQSLHKMAEPRRKFTIDDYLGHREKALGHLRTLDAFDEVRDYTAKHGLYQAALGLYRYDEDRRTALTDLYAAHLEASSKFREAGLAYESLGNLARAAACYQSAGTSSWRECLAAAQQQMPPLSDAAFSAIAAALADALYEAKDYVSAAAVHVEYLASAAAAIRCLCKGYQFADAFRLAARQRQSGSPDLTDHLDACLAEALSSSTELLADCRAQLGAQVPRILELRRKAAEDPLGFLEGGDRPGGADLPDDVSVAASSRLSTSASLFTRYTGKDGRGTTVAGTATSSNTRAAARNRKREEKKRARGRKGTVYEEEYLVNSVRRLVERVASTQPEIERLVFALARRGMTERARAVEKLMCELVDGCRAAVTELWPPPAQGEKPKQEEPQGPAEDGAAANGVVLGPDGRAIIVRDQEEEQDPPTLRDFARLSLLG